MHHQLFDLSLGFFLEKQEERRLKTAPPTATGKRVRFSAKGIKADRKRRALLVLATHFEPHADRQDAESALRDELDRLAEWLELEVVVYS